MDGRRGLVPSNFIERIAGRSCELFVSLSILILFLFV